MIWMENYDEHYAFGFLMLVSVQLVFFPGLPEMTATSEYDDA